ncbi:hypothetical protein [Thermoanaerobacterium sp. RBIITD]|uniref:hypothetical protein n=1 Tax=Thermoanaerobacterium sp. RBIITD TaxID=1550240 RepID=UPI000BB9A30F|nr:hypothetical protein [Thermoanaerobacterium sp. RBIITD]SNX53686.1 hypothetical protein SAMN05660242_1254 [Thermoanaerobacterium sp. RBIITD]
MSNFLWILESTKSDKFPYRLSIKKDDTTLLSLFVQNKWPGAGSQIFCLRDTSEQSNEWTLRFFQAIISHESESIPDVVAEEISKYQTKNDFTGGIYYDIRKEILENINGDFTISDLRNKFSSANDSTIRKVLNDLKKEGLIINHGRGKGSTWTKTIK